MTPESKMWKAGILATVLAFAAVAWAQEPLDGRDGRQLLLENFRPKPELKVDEHRLTRAKFPVVDVHSHLAIRTMSTPAARDAYLELMDRNNIAACVSLDGKLGDAWADHADYLWKEHRDRFLIFVSIDFRGAGKKDEPARWDCQRPEFARVVAKQLAEAKERGASGVKFFKSFGLEWKDADGSLLKIDDPRWDPIWQACGELGLPLLMHVGDPVAFFEPIDEKNERWEELHRRPEWSFPADKFPSHAALLEAWLKIVARHPKTQFIGAHFANNPEDLKTLGGWLDKHPNLHIEFASRIAELGRQPFTARKFFLKYADRILFGTDGPWPEERVRLYWRFLETEDEYFPYSEKEFPPQGLWRIYGINLPDEVLKKVYHETAARLIPGVREKLAARLKE